MKSEPKPQTNPSGLYSTRRIESLTDGVFAIAMTLMVLNLTVPVLSGSVTNQSLWQALTKLGPNLFSLALSFAILGIMWSVHMRQFESIERVDRLTTTLNTLRLFIVVLIPFTTALNANYSSLLIAQIFYPVNLFLLALVTYIQGIYVSGHHDFYRTYNKQQVESGNAKSLSFVLAAGIVCIGTVFIGSLAFFGYFLVALFDPLLQRRIKKTN